MTMTMMYLFFVLAVVLVFVGGCEGRSSSQQPPTAAFFFAKTTANGDKTVTEKKDALLVTLEQLIVESQNGIDTSKDDEIQSIMTQIASTVVDRKNGNNDQRINLPGKWELIYTTEKEVNFFRTSWPFAKVISIVQEIDLYNTETIQNSINFERNGAFIVNGIAKPSASATTTVDTTEYDRVEFEFQSAIIKVFGQSISIPPVGKGWFDTMYVDDKYRLSNDSRGDWSVFRRL